MYVPPAFAETRLPVLQDAIRRTGLATLVTAAGGAIEATHLPLLLDAADGERGTLLGHVARANPQWRQAPTIALAIFQGPEAYVSPGWYATKRATGKVVPTWNYVTVHAQGRLEAFDEPVRLRALVARLTDLHEAGRGAPWSVDDAPEPFVQSQLRGIVGLVLRIDRLAGKWKMSQNRPADDRAGVIAGLGDDPVAELVPR